MSTTGRPGKDADTGLLQATLDLQLAASAEGFDWPNLDGVWAKLAEEIVELREAQDRAARTEEIGDLLFMVLNLSRHLAVDPIESLCQANAKFSRRFGYVMAHAQSLPADRGERRLEAMEALWVEAKQLEKSGG